MIEDPTALYSAFQSGDPRFDGVFFVGVMSTGIYCRPICPAKTPKASNCRFFPSAAAAEKASLRPCLRCRPELAPGTAPVDDGQRIASDVVRQIEEGLVDDGGGMEKIATMFELSTRQIRRIVQKELGVSPIDLISTRRLLLAKQLLTDTRLPIIEVAYASGFSSLRRFNDAFRSRYRMPPTRMRKAGGGARMHHPANESISLRLSYRSPFDWMGLLDFLRKRALPGVEYSFDDVYMRTVRVGDRTGWIIARHDPAERAVLVEIAHALTPSLPALLSRLRRLFDLDARPDAVTAHLRRDKILADAVEQNPGLRVPGAFDGFELAVRAVLGQQISVKAATTLAGRFVEAYGDVLGTPHEHLTHLFPTPERMAAESVDGVARLGIIQTRARSIITLAEEVASGRLSLNGSPSPATTIKLLLSIPGVGPWTAQYIAMRALHWPDAFPKEDVALRNRLNGVSPRKAQELSQAWRPWRSYATLHLWNRPAIRPIAAAT